MDEHANTQETAITRRGSLVRLGGLFAATVAAGGWKAATGDSEAKASSAGPAAVSTGLVTCVLTPEQTEGPYYVEDAKVRRNITEGRPGIDLRLRLGVVDVSTCRAVKGAAVDVWHADAGGVYSGVAREDTVEQTFLRGIQRTDASGLAVFRTIYPGWYPGRTVHVHVKVHLGGEVVHTGQLYFPDSVTDAVYRRAPYSSRPGRDMRNAVDSVFRNGGSKSLMRLSKSGTGYVGTIVMGVQAT